MKKYKKVLAALMLMTVAVIAAGCKPEDNGENNEVTVTVTTVEPSEITKTTAICGAEAIVSEGAELAEIGVCWNTHENPTVNDKLLSTTTWNEPFSCTLTNLEPGTEYYVRAFALCNSVYYYGENKSFTTESTAGNGSLNGHDYLDLGLPSGTLWATCNVGANAPEKYGDYFAWGETTPKTTYNWSTYKYCNGEPDQLTKYCDDPLHGYNGFTDDLTTLLPEDDAATVNWGDGWYMPTYDQWVELYENTRHFWATQNDVNGRIFVGANDNRLFVPFPGYRQDNELNQADTIGYYWSSMLGTGIYVYDLVIASGSCHMGYYLSRGSGLSVRPVCSSR